MTSSISMEPVQTVEPLEGPPDEPSEEHSPFPLPPESLEEAGLSEELVAGLVLKILCARGALLGFDLSEALALPMTIVDGILQGLQERRWVEVRETRGPGRGEYVYALTGPGQGRAAQELELSRYAGPAPVPLAEFRHWIERQTMGRTRISMEELRRAFDGMVLSDELLETLGPAVNSGRSLFLFGDSGNGKTLLAEKIARVFGDRYFVPHSVLVDGTIMVVHDSVHHGHDYGHDSGAAPEPEPQNVPEPEPDDAPEATPETESDPDPGRGAASQAEPGPPTGPPIGLVRSIPPHDRRFAVARRPVVVTGGELTLDQLDLQWDPTGRMYQAPPQLKAAGGVLVVDDLGRQRVEVRQLLNRWVVPLERRRDHLTLRSGRKLIVPFDCFVVFSTNLEPGELADEAFLRRIQYKIEVPDPGREEYARIFRACCEERRIAFCEEAVDHLFEEVYGDGAAAPRACHPRDILDHLVALAGFRNEEPVLSPELLEKACRSYFLPGASP